MSGEAKVLTGLLQRRALEQAFAELGHTADPVEVQQQAQAIAGYGPAALQHLLTLLDTPDPQLRGGLGQVARHLPHEQVVSALRAVARDQGRGDQARLAAVTLLERFLDESIDSSLMGNLGDPEVAARQSLAELVAAMDEETVSVVEYLEQLGQQPPEVVDMLLEALPTVDPSPHLATFLRMLAQGEDARVARQAVEVLVKLRTPAAARALSSLIPNLPPTLAPIAERGLRKLRFSGVQEAADLDSEREPWYAPGLGWRALISTVDASGSQFLWFIGSPGIGDDADANDGRTVFFTVLLQDPLGVRDASGSLDASADHVPPKRREGAIHYIARDGAAHGLTLVEAPFTLACQVLREALALNWVAGEATPVGYRLFSPLIWSSESAGDCSGERLGLTPAPDLALTEAELVAGLDHPAFYGWFNTPAGVELKPSRGASYARRCRTMSRWLALAGDEAGARLAATYAHHFEGWTAQASTIVASARLASAGAQGRNLQDQP